MATVTSYTKAQLDTQLADKIGSATKGAPDGVAPLDETGKVPLGNLPPIPDSGSETVTSADVTDFVPAVQARIGTDIIPGENMGKDYNETTGQTTLHATTAGITEIDYDDLPTMSAFFVKKVGTTWTRPTTRQDIGFIFRGVSPGPDKVIPPATGGYYDNGLDVFLPTPS